MQGFQIDVGSAGHLTRTLNALAAAWLVLLAVIILYDVVGRGVFDAPFMGAHEIVGNSVVGILFLQLPNAIQRSGMARTTLIYDKMGPWGRNLIDGSTSVCGIVFFCGIAIGGWGDMITGWQIGEYEGIGALEVPVYPIRTLTVVLSFLSATIYLLFLIDIVRHVSRRPTDAL
jgi:TRAP-type C4-dicarboxylate transport system permease small subunit